MLSTAYGGAKVTAYAIADVNMRGKPENGSEPRLALRHVSPQISICQGTNQSKPD